MPGEASKKRSSPKSDNEKQPDPLSSSLNESKRKRPKVISTMVPERSSTGHPSSPPSSANVRVVARLRPLSSKERNEQSKEAITASVSPVLPSPTARIGELTRICVEDSRHFDYDAVFAPGTTQSRVYERSVGSMVKENIFKGFNVTILAYGQTGSGKTYTMGTASDGAQCGDENDAVSAVVAATNEQQRVELNEPSEGDGVIPRAVYDLFSTRRSLVQGDERVKVEMSYLEIYNEEARDLLCANEAAATNLFIRDSKTDGVYVQNLSWEVVRSPQEVNALMSSASHRRATASTQMNAVSSRSHAICTLRVSIAPVTKSATAVSNSDDSAEEVDDSCDAGSGEKVDVEGDADADDMKHIHAKLTLVDLAGSERIKRTGAEGNRMKEGININKGLFVLGQVVSALSDVGQGNGGAHMHIPYRDSKLTRLLQDSLGGNSKTIMMACVSPADSNIEESINTLRYAQRARNIKNSAVRNVVATTLSVEDAMALRQENQRLQMRVDELEKVLKKYQPFDVVASDDPMSVSEAESYENRECNASTLPQCRAVSTEEPDIEQLDLVTSLRAKCATYLSNIESLKKKSEAAAEDALAASLNADRSELKLERLQALFAQHGLSIPETDGSEQSEQKSVAVKLRSEIADLKKQLHEARTDATVARTMAASVVASKGDLASVEAKAQTETGDDSSEDEYDSSMDVVDESLTSELVVVSGQIEQKEELAKRANKERECMNAMRSHFEAALTNLQDEVEVLSAEKAKLFEKISRQGVRSGKKPAEETSKRIDELEMRIRDLKTQAAEHKRTLRLRDKAEKKCAQLAAEITAAKQRRAALQRKLKEESVERRQEKKKARIEATRLLRDSQKLKHELQKVKHASERQANVLRRKAEEASNLKKQLMNRQMQRKTARVPAASDADDTHSDLDEQHLSSVKSWIESEVEHAVVMNSHEQQLVEQRDLLEASLEKQKELQSVSGDDSTLKQLAEEINSRREMISELEKRAEQVIENPEDQFTVRDMLSFDAFSLNEVRAAFLLVLEQLVSTKVSNESVKASKDAIVESAVRTAVSKERATSEEAILKLKLEHSDAMSALMQSTSATIGRNVRESMSGNGPEVEAKLVSYLDQCSKVKDTVSADLRDMRIAHDELQETLDFVANGMKAGKLPKKKKKGPRPRVSFAEQSLISAPEIMEEDSDDSDWSPDTPGFKLRVPTPTYSTDGESKHDVDVLPVPFSLVAMQNDTDEVEAAPATKATSAPALSPSDESHDSSVTSKDEATTSVDYSELKVVDLKKILRELGLAVSGKKAQLINRIKTHERSTHFETSESSDRNENPRHHDKENVTAVRPAVKLSNENGIDEENPSSRRSRRNNSTIKRAPLGDKSASSSNSLNQSHDFMKDTKTSAAKRTKRLSPDGLPTASAKKRKRDKAMQLIDEADRQISKTLPPTASAKKRKRNDALQAITNAEKQLSMLGASM